MVEREEEPSIPSKVVHRLSDPCGTDLYALINRFADASLTRLPDDRIDAHAWGSLGLLADLWEAGMVEELACEGKSPTDLARGPHGLSYHQVNRRAGLFKTGEMATVLRVLLPLASLPEHEGKCLRLSVRGEEEAPGGEGEEVWAEVEPGGAIQSCATAPADPHGWGRGEVKDWIPAILDGRDDQVLAGGEEQLVGDSLRCLYEALWSPVPF